MPPRPLSLAVIAVAAALALTPSLRAQNDRWYPVAADTATSRSPTPSPLRTWQVTLPLRRGAQLWAHNPTPDSVAIPSVEVWDCVNIDGGCGLTPLDTILAPGDSLVLLTVHPRQWNAKYRFRWTHYWAPRGPAAPAEAYVLPTWAVAPLDAAAFVEHYEEAGYLTPRTLEPDLDGDGAADLVLAVQDHSATRGVAILLAARPTPVVLGAGQPFGPWGRDFAGLRRWTLGGPDSLTRGPQYVHLTWADGTEGDIQWTATGYVWRAQ
jgi:hypothetical protein